MKPTILSKGEPAIRGIWHTPLVARVAAKLQPSRPAAPQAASAATAAAPFESPRISAASRDSNRPPAAFLHQGIFLRALAHSPGSALSARWLAPLPTFVCSSRPWLARTQATLFPHPSPCVRTTKLTRAAYVSEFWKVLHSAPQLRKRMPQSNAPQNSSPIKDSRLNLFPSMGSIELSNSGGSSSAR